MSFGPPLSKTLRDALLTQEPSWVDSFVKAVAAQIALILAEVHSQGMVVGNLAASTVRVGPLGLCMLTNLHNCVKIGSTLNLDGVPAWNMAPEHL